jgi:hypothetical protein
VAAGGYNSDHHRFVTVRYQSIGRVRALGRVVRGFLVADEADLSEALRRIAEQLEAIALDNQRIETLLRVIAQPILEVRLRSIFPDRKHLRAYELSDGERGTREIGALVGVDQKTISRWWRAWEANHGIVKKAGKRGQYVKRYALDELVARFFVPGEEANSSDSRQVPRPEVTTEAGATQSAFNL